MNINDIPLPPTPPKKSLLYDTSQNTDIKNQNSSINKSLSSKRHLNKLPVGIIKKSEHSNVRESNKRDLFLPSVADRMQLALSVLNPAQSSQLEMLLNATKLKPIEINNVKHRDKSFEKLSELREDRKRKRRESSERRKSKKRRKPSYSEKSIERSISENHGNNNNSKTVFLKSEVIVKHRHTNDNKPEDRRDKSKLPRRDEYRFYRENSEKIDERKYERYDRRRPEERKTERFRGRSRSKKHKKKSKKKSKKHRKKSIKSSSISSPTSSPFSTMYNTNPLKPSPNIDKEIEDNNQPSITVDKNSVATATALANDCLKQLSMTLNTMSIVYQNVCSKFPLKKPLPESSSHFPNPPLPQPEELEPDKSIPVNNTVGPQTPELPCEKENENFNEEVVNNDNHDEAREPSVKETPGNAINKQESNSINIDNLSHISNTSFGSKNMKSPYYSLNVSSHSKESELGEYKLRPLIPKISSFKIDYKDIDESKICELFLKGRSKYFIDQIKCSCSMPNPDAWNEGVRSCSSGQSCLLAQLKIECDNVICPTECMCCNTQFADLEHSVHKMHNIEFFFDIYQSVPWKIRAKKTIEKNRLIFEVAGMAELIDDNWYGTSADHPLLTVTKHIGVNLRRDAHSYMFYLNYGIRDQANVTIEKWMVDGEIRLGVFAMRNIEAREELVVFFPNHTFSVVYKEPDSAVANEAQVLDCVLHVLHESVSRQSYLRIIDSLLSSENQRVVMEHFRDLGGPAIFCRLCDGLCPQESLSRDLFEKLIDILISVPYRNRRDTELLGIDIQEFVLGLGDRWRDSSTQISSGSQLDQLAILRNRLAIAIDINRDAAKCGQTKGGTTSQNSDILQCRLPPYWLSRQCVANDDVRVFFCHRLTKMMQWDMPVYPWEANDDNEVDIYDYNQASLIQVTHDEIQQMYVNLNKMYEQKQKKIQAKGNAVRRKRDKEDNQRKEAFKKKISAFITSLLKPYRNSSCKEGKIESDADLHYLTNKLAQTILFKELKILNDKIDHLEVSAQVELKTRTYVQTYMQSRGITYKRPNHCVTSEQKPVFNKPD